jgi:hypothetical protein
MSFEVLETSFETLETDLKRIMVVLMRVFSGGLGSGKTHAWVSCGSSKTHARPKRAYHLTHDRSGKTQACVSPDPCLA